MTDSSLPYITGQFVVWPVPVTTAFRDIAYPRITDHPKPGDVWAIDLPGRLCSSQDMGETWKLHYSIVQNSDTPVFFKEVDYPYALSAEGSVYAIGPTSDAPHATPENVVLVSTDQMNISSFATMPNESGFVYIDNGVAYWNTRTMHEAQSLSLIWGYSLSLNAVLVDKGRWGFSDGLSFNFLTTPRPLEAILTSTWISRTDEQCLLLYFLDNNQSLFAGLNYDTTFKTLWEGYATRPLRKATSHWPHDIPDHRRLLFLDVEGRLHKGWYLEPKLFHVKPGRSGLNCQLALSSSADQSKTNVEAVWSTSATGDDVPHMLVLETTTSGHGPGEYRVALTLAKCGLTLKSGETNQLVGAAHLYNQPDVFTLIIPDGTDITSPKGFQGMLIHEGTGMAVNFPDAPFEGQTTVDLHTLGPSDASLLSFLPA